MKNIFKMLGALLMLAAFGATAQEVSKESMIKNYTVHEGEKSTEYQVTVKTVEKSMVKLDKSDANKREQDRIDTKEKVSKMIYIDKGADKNFENVIKLTYTKEKEDDFAMRMDEDGFVFTVYGKDLSYYFSKNDYEVNKVNNNFFKIEKM